VASAAAAQPVTSSARVLGLLVGDPERTLPGENPATVEAREAMHWAAVHAELLEVRLELLRELRATIQRVVDPSVAAGLEHNARALDLAVDRSRYRVSFWAHRIEQLARPFAAST